jgi:ribose 5-phosphate isomerase B
MIAEHRLREIVQRVAARVMAERGRTEFPAGRAEIPGVARPGGVHVAVHPSGRPPRPAAEIDGESDARDLTHGSSLVTARTLEGTPDGGRYELPEGAIVTDLAAEEAWRRRIVLFERGAPPASTRRDARLRVALGADHGGYLLKQALVEWVRESGHVAFDLGAHDERPVDYPDYAQAVAEAVADARADLGILVDSVGIGSAMTANKVPGVRAAPCRDVNSARSAREHNHANVLTLGGMATSPAEAREIVRVFLATAEGADRHARRVEKMRVVEAKYLRPRGARDAEVPR